MSERLGGMPELPATGERFIPGAYENQQMALEHFQRYVNARHFCAGKVVLDIASGEGYGSCLLADVAQQVVGVDIAEEAVRHASDKYGDKKNLHFVTGNVTAIPLDSHSVDVIVSFETIEHVDAESQLRMVAEFKRVLKPDGLLLISSPNKLVYTDERKKINSFHVHELYRQEFLDLIASAFKNVQAGGQKFLQGSMLVWASAPTESVRYPSQSFDAGLYEPMYTIALASDGELPSQVNSIYESTDFVNVESALHETQSALVKSQDALEDTQEALKDKVSELASCHEVVQRQQQALEKMTAVVSEKESELEAAGRRFRSAESTLHETQSALVKSQDALGDTQEALRDKVSELASCHEVVQRQQQALEKMTTSVSEKESELEAAGRRFRSAESTLHETQSALVKSQDALEDTQEELKIRSEALADAKMEIDRLRGTYGYRTEYMLHALFTSAFYKSRTLLIKRRIAEILRQHWQNLKGCVFTGHATRFDCLLYKLLKCFSARVKYYLAPPQPPPLASQGTIPPEGTPVETICYDAWYEGDADFSDRESDVKPIALYLPQFHTFRENDEWWGKGFTEWTNTRKSKPRFASHYQPREPHADIGYYDLSDWHVMQRQAELARKHGIYGFCFYNYWFSGKRLMEKPVDLFLAHPEIDIHFCLCWANENWTRAWDGGVSQILIGQGYENDSLQYIIDLKKYIEDPRYIRVGGKPVVMIYRPGLLPNASKTFQCWREWARNNGIGEILIWIQRGCSQNGDSLMIEGADAEVEFPPNGTAEFNQIDPRAFGLEIGEGYLLNYKDLVRNVITGNGYVERYAHTVYRGVMLGWDNAARRRSGFCTWYGFSLPDYYKWCRYVVEDARKRHGKDDRFFFVNAWNEWAEGTYLEPDSRFGYAAINVTSRALFDMPLHPKLIAGEGRRIDALEEFKAQNLLDRGIPLFPYGLYGMYHPESVRAPAWAWSDCNKRQDPVAELQRLRERFVSDEQRACEKMKLKRLYIDDMPLPTVALNGSIAVHLHLYFIDMLDFVFDYLSNVPFEFDLYISIPDVVECNAGDITSRMRRVKKVGKVQIRRCENRGRDIAPLICTFGRELSKYDYIAHFHTKKSSHTPTHSVWAQFIFEHLLGSEGRVRRILSLLQNDYRVVSPPDFLLMPEEPSGWGSNLENAQKLVALSGMDFDLQKEFPVIEFPQGSMFWARGATLRRFFTLPITEKDFPAEPIGTDGSLAHALERLFFVWGIEENAGVCQVFLKGEEDAFGRMR